METIDVTQIEPRRKHPAIFEKFDALQPGEGFVINNDHDPKPLYYQMIAERGEVFDWEYLEEGPETWKVRISRLKDGETSTIGELVAEDYRKAEVFKKFGLDFCCGGKRKLNQACKKKGVDVNEVEKELEKVDQQEAPSASQEPATWNLAFLTDHIINTHHNYVREAIPFLEEYLFKIRRVHGDRHPELHEVADQFVELAQELDMHMRKEEQILFPYIKELQNSENEGKKIAPPEFGTIENPINMMEEEHESAGDNFEKIEELTDGFTPPEGACMSYQVSFKKLKEFRDDLHLHIHLENNILFPRSIKLEKELM